MNKHFFSFISTVKFNRDSTDHTKGCPGNGRSRGFGEPFGNERHQVSEWLAVGAIANCDFHGDEAIFDRLGHHDTVNPNAEASR